MTIIRGMPMPQDILVVDEKAETLTALVAALRHAGHPAIGAPSFRDGVRILTATTPALLVCSLQLGPYNGLHLLVRGRAEHPTLPVIMIGPACEVVAREARALGAAVYLPQPIDTEALLSEVTHLFEAAADAERPVARPSLTVAYMPA
jgi:DNA-binding response OmpR family regulator